MTEKKVTATLERLTAHHRAVLSGEVPIDFSTVLTFIMLGLLDECHNLTALGDAVCRAVNEKSQEEGKAS